ncbi:PE-PGRS family protein [Kitasatospora sp. NBC_01266]|uniref:PE-PGRS family protein n=1 Tax=Kitasatospora sp. NBC_01266 TaxID=2903572 RepID=UPI002E2FFB7D|nr:PE-PGRS family protein [Kitasatospora sp. NBC_01266]
MTRPPQWQQDVNRHSQLVDPVVTIQELSRFGSLRTTRVDYALVFTTAQGGLDTFLPPHRPSRKDLTTRRWTSVYEVDTGQHEFGELLTMPSRDDAFSFEVALSCGWQVVEPGAFVASGVRNVPAMAQGLVDQLIRPVLRQYPMAESDTAEMAAQAALMAVESHAAKYGLWLGCALQIRQDEAALQHARELREIEFARQKLDPRHQLHLREDELAAERSLAQGQHAHRIAMQEQNFGHERELIRSQYELELREYEVKKIEYYAHYLERGGPQAMAMQLAQHPEDAQLIMANLRDHQLRLINNQLAVAMQALGGGPGGLEEHQLDEPRKLAASVIREVLSTKFGPTGFGPTGFGDPAGAVTSDAAASELIDSVPAAPVDAVPGTGTGAPQAPSAAPGAESAPVEGADEGPIFGYRVPTQPPAR